MAGTDFKISNLIDKSIISDLKDITKETYTTTHAYAALVNALAQGIHMNAGNLSEIQQKTKLFNTTLKDIYEAQNKLADLQEKQLKLLSDISKKIDQLVTPLDKLVNAMDAFTSKVNTANAELDKTSTSSQKAAQGMQNASKQVSSSARDYSVIIKSIEAYDAQINELYKTQTKNQETSNSIKADIIDLTSSYNRGRISMEEYTDEMAKLKKRQTELSEESKKYNTLLRTHARVVVSAKGSYDEMNAAVLELERRYKSLEKADRDSAVGKEMLDNIEALKSELTSIDKSLRNYQRNVGNYASAFDGLEDKVKDLLGLNSNFAQSIMSLNNSGGGFFNNLSAGARAFSQTLSGLLLNPAFLAIAGIASVGAVAKFWYDYNKGIQEATKLTKQFTGATGDELKQNRNEVQALADMYDKDFRETLISINSVSKQFGISFEEAFQAIKDGFIAGADANGEFLDNLKEYPAYFREAGVSAREFIAITAQANQQGIYSDKGIDVIKEGNIRIREMTKATASALEGIGISSKKVQEELQDGSKTTFDIIQEVSTKLQEFPESSSAVGTALADIFGGPGEDAGLNYIKLLATVDKSLDKVKDKAGELGELEEAQLKSQMELENAIASLFDYTGGTFERLTTKAKIFINEGITSMIKGFVNVSNSVIDLWNDLKGIRTIIEDIIAWGKISVSVMVNGYRLLGKVIGDLGEMLEGVFMLDFDMIKSGYNRMKSDLKETADSIYKDTVNAVDKASANIQKRIKPIKLSLEVETKPTSPQGNKVIGNGDRKLTDDERRALEKAREEQLRIEKEYEASKLELMNEGLEKELAKIRQNYTQRIAEVKGNTEKENETRKNLTEKMQQELASKEISYYLEQEKTKTQLALASVKKESEEEKALRLHMIDLTEEDEINALNGNYENLEAVRAKYQQQRIDEEERYASARIKKIQENAALESIYRTGAFEQEMQELDLLRAKGLISEEEYNKRSLDLTSAYSVEQAKTSLDLINQMLDVENLSDDEALKLKQQKASAEIELAEAVMEAEINATEQATEAQKLHIKKLSEAINQAMDIVNAFGDLGSAIYDAKIQKLEEEIDANEEAGESEIAKIEELEERGAITTEEAEARKRAAEDKTARKNEELEKKKARLQEKQAKLDKAINIAGIISGTALAIINALQTKPFIPAGLAAAAIAGSMGAIQLATALATPIPKYAKGTDFHKGGHAIVGDGGVSETIITDKGAYLTPSVPTLVDIPRGAQVIPFAIDMEKMKASANDLNGLMAFRRENDLPPISIVNDYSDLEMEIRALKKSQQSGFYKLAKAIKDNNYQQFAKSV